MGTNTNVWVGGGDHGGEYIGIASNLCYACERPLVRSQIKMAMMLRSVGVGDEESSMYKCEV